MTTGAANLRAYDGGIYALDSGYLRPIFDAIHLVVHNGRVALVDTATAHAAPLVLQALQSLGLDEHSVDWVLLTHVHLDHAGGAGALMRLLPNARLGVHPRGARHMIDPGKLWAATCDVYGKAQAEAMYGGIDPIDAARVVELHDGATVDVGGRLLHILDTPGHAKHHVCIHDPLTGGVFTGDTFGISYHELDVDGRPFIIPSSTPAQFDPAAMRASIQRILALNPSAVYLTHYAQRCDVPRLGALVLRLIGEYVALAQHAQAEWLASGGRSQELAPEDRRQRSIEQGLAKLYVDEARQHGVTLSSEAICAFLDVDLRLNAAGLVAWLDSQT